MSQGHDREHLLRVLEGGDWEVVHLDSCPTETVAGEAPFGGYTRHTCSVAWQLDYWGTDFLTDGNGQDVKISELAPGDYRLVHEWYTPESSFEDAESDLWVELPAVVPA